MRKERKMDKHGMGMQGHEGGWGLIEALGSLVGGMFLLGVLALVLWAASQLLFVRNGSGGPTDAAENILRERFARGEIPAEDFERSLEILRINSPNAASEDPSDDEPPQGRYETYVRDALRRLRLGRGPSS